VKDIILAKKEQVEALVSKMNESAAYVAFNYQGLSVADFMQLRNNLRAQGVTVQVIKNNISRRAASLVKHEEFSGSLKGPMAIAFSAEDIIAPAKELFAFAKANEHVHVTTGVVNDEFYSHEQLSILATLPSREVLLTQLAAGMIGTLSQLAIGLNMLTEKDSTEESTEETQA